MRLLNFSLLKKLTKGRGNVIWIASYPRSGNKWFRCMLGYLLTDGKFVMTAENPINDFIPDIHIKIPRLYLTQDFAPIKTHFLPDHPETLKCKAAKAIYLVRHPADVLVSVYKFLIRHGKLPADHAEYLGESLAFQNFAEEFIAHGGYLGWKNDFGTWESSVTSWLSSHLNYEVHPVNFSLLKKDPHMTLQRMTNFLEMPVSEQLIASAISINSFSETKKREVDHKGLGVGTSGHGFDSLSQSNQDKFLERFGSLMEKVNI